MHLKADHKWHTHYRFKLQKSESKHLLVKSYAFFENTLETRKIKTTKTSDLEMSYPPK